MCNFGQNFSQNGAGIYAMNSSADILKSDFLRNYSWASDYNSGGGGGIYLEDCPSVDITECYLDSNIVRMTACGAGIYSMDSNTKIHTCAFINNRYDYRGGPGGGIYIGGSFQPEISNCLLEKNSSSAGGGIYCSADAIISNCEIRDNIANSCGGGIYCSGSVILSDCLITKNRTGHNIDFSNSDFFIPEIAVLPLTDPDTPSIGGAGLCSYGGDITLQRCVISEKSITEYGAGDGIGFAAEHGSLSLINCEIIHNSYSELYSIHNPKIRIENCTIARHSGCALDIPEASATIINSILWNNGSLEIYRYSWSP